MERGAQGGHLRVRRKVVLFCISLCLALSAFMAVDYHYTVIFTEGVSMYRTLGVVSICLVRRLHFNSVRDIEDIRVGDIVVFRVLYGGRLWSYSKRVLAKKGDKIWVRGEHPFAHDSRFYGWVSVFQVWGKVVWHVVLVKPSSEDLKLIKRLEGDIKKVKCPYPDYPPEMPN
jgi:hypothetical protein